MAGQVLYILLVIDIIALALVAGSYLFQRRLTPLEYCLWGLLALLPIIGPFLIIAGRPGVWRTLPLPGRVEGSRLENLPSLAGRVFALPGPRRKRIASRTPTEPQEPR